MSFWITQTEIFSERCDDCGHTWHGFPCTVMVKGSACPCNSSHKGDDNAIRVDSIKD